MLLNTIKSGRRDTATLTGRVNLGTTGAVTNQSKRKLSGFVMTRTGVGIYTITLDRTATRWTTLLGLTITIIGANATYPVANGTDFFISSDLTATTGVITLKFMRTDTGAVAEIEDAAKLLVSLILTTAVEEVA